MKVTKIHKQKEEIQRGGGGDERVIKKKEDEGIEIRKEWN